MMSEDFDSAWAEVADAARGMFNVWVDGDELNWAKEAWRHLFDAGLVCDEGPMESAATHLRLVTLALIYEEFCGAAWDENSDSGVILLSEGLDIDPVALGCLAAQANKDFSDDIFDSFDLREAALAVVTDLQRYEIHKCLKSAYGGNLALYSRMYKTHSYSDGTSQEPSEDSDEVFDVTGPNMDALSFIENGFHLG